MRFIYAKGKNWGKFQGKIFLIAIFFSISVKLEPDNFGFWVLETRPWIPNGRKIFGRSREGSSGQIWLKFGTHTLGESVGVPFVRFLKILIFVSRGLGPGP